ncbi:MAG: Gfo/Idh/MocA family oxidoreductase [Gluconacetobacter diazotrophicus]|nr:Gfo/Idh/MocA family oxidoreductase [Gluconacetobacter diazotrophicus]
MSLKSVLGLEESRKVRYGFVALGDITQESMLPGVSHTGNSEVTAFVTSDPEKAREVGRKYGVEHVYSYEQYGDLLRSGQIDAVYVATPNWRHEEFVVPALEAGIHVLVEKPLEIDVERAERIVAAQRRSQAKLMTAYRLHFEPATTRLVERIRAGDLGEVLFFSSTFGLTVDPTNHRASSGVKAGPIYDMGPYPVNASRYVFEAEPEEVVSAVGTNHRTDLSGDEDFHDTVAVTLRFPGNRLAQFVLSYALNAIDTFVAAGTRGSITLNPSYMFGAPLEHYTAIGESKGHDSFKSTDHFGGELRYFSECILENRDPEPDAEEGLADVRVLDGIAEAVRTGGPVTLPPFTRTRRIDPAHAQTLSAKKPPELVNVSSPAAGKEKAAPAN